MHIVLLSGLDESTPPPNYGSVETLVYCAARELVALGHEVTVFATEDSEQALDFCNFRAYPHLPVGARHLGLDYTRVDELKYQVMQQVLPEALKLGADVVHNNEYTGVIAWSELPLRPAHMLTTTHWPSDCSVTSPPFKKAPGHKVLTLSDAQQCMWRKLHPQLTFVGTVHNCISHHRFIPEGVIEREEQLAWIGRFDPMKGAKEAVAIARRLDMPLVMAGKVDDDSTEYFREVVQPLLDANRGLVEFRGEVSQIEGSKILASACAFLMTSMFAESCPLTPMEALAAGTPVVANDRGAMRELVRHGVTGFVIPMRGDEIDIPRFTSAVRMCRTIDSAACYESAERFRPARMARDYASVYTQMVEVQPRRVRRR
jgi:glycosyltransferase involved in cell wall biosynthesis